MKIFFGILSSRKFVLILPLHDFILVFRFFSIAYWFPIKFFLILLLTLSQMLLYFSSNSSSLVSFTVS